MLLLNLLVAILANTYNIYDLRSSGLYLSKILSTRGELLYDDNYGAFLAGTPPINLVQIPFIPIAFLLQKDSDFVILCNDLLMRL